MLPWIQSCTTAKSTGTVACSLEHKTKGICIQQSSSVGMIAWICLLFSLLHKRQPLDHAKQWRNLTYKLRVGDEVFISCNLKLGEATHLFDINIKSKWKYVSNTPVEIHFKYMMCNVYYMNWAILRLDFQSKEKQKQNKTCTQKKLKQFYSYHSRNDFPFPSWGNLQSFGNSTNR